MTDRSSAAASRGQTAADALKGWVMVALTLIFVVLYAAALAGWLRPLPDEKMVTRLEPIIFVIIGYYFGRMPAQQNEKALKEEIGRQTQKADAAQHAKEQAQQSREGLEEKVKNARAIITSAAPAASARGVAERADRAHEHAGREEALRASVDAALNVLNS
jgi:predicted Co/Zn/Cd cation transporter (cation efflux family)